MAAGSTGRSMPPGSSRSSSRLGSTRKSGTARGAHRLQPPPCLHDTCASQARPRGQAALPRPGHTGSTASRWLPVPAQRRSLAAAPVLRAVAGRLAGSAPAARRSQRHPFPRAGQTRRPAPAIRPARLPCCAAFQRPPSGRRPARARPSACGIQGAGCRAAHPWRQQPSAIRWPAARRVRPRHHPPTKSADPGCGQGSKLELPWQASGGPAQHRRPAAPGAHVPGAEPQAPTHRSPPTVPAAKL